MRTNHRQRGLTLVEMTLVVATIVVLLGLALPAVRSLIDAFHSEGGARTMISSALGSARAMALTNQRYTGVRFQKLCTSADPANPLKGLIEAPQYMIFITHEDPARMRGLANGFRAVEGLKPIKLPDTIGVMDLMRVDRDYNPSNYQTYIVSEIAVAGDAAITLPRDIADATSFSVVFSPAGKIVIHGVRVRNRDGLVDSRNNGEISFDDVFNKMLQVNRRYAGYETSASPPGAGMFYQDDYYDPDLNDYGDIGLGPESSRTSFVVYEKDKFAQALKKGRPWSDYMARQAARRIHVAPYTGELIGPE